MMSSIFCSTWVLGFKLDHTYSHCKACDYGNWNFVLILAVDIAKLVCICVLQEIFEGCVELFQTFYKKFVFIYWLC
jgi:hypothetical protein